MPAVTIRNLSEETHRALKVRAAEHNRSAEAEMRAVLEDAVRPANRLRLGTALANMTRNIELTNADVETLEPAPRKTAALRMILLDTNVVSQAMKPEPNPAVRNWLDEQTAETLYLSSVTIGELMFGFGARPKRRRKGKLAAALHGVLEVFTNRILPFDIGAPRRYADLAVKARAAGRASHARRLYRRKP
jgi:plasmid stability protein/predicted nucleic acid-binding protein